MQRESSDLNFERAEACSFFLNKNNNNHIQRHNLRFLYNLLTALQTISNTYTQMAQAQLRALSAYHVQRVVCHMVQRDSSAIKYDRVKITFIWALFYWLKTINQWRKRGNWSNQRKCLVTSFSKCHILKLEDSSPMWDWNPHNSIGGRLGKQMCYPLHHMFTHWLKQKTLQKGRRPEYPKKTASSFQFLHKTAL